MDQNLEQQDDGTRPNPDEETEPAQKREKVEDRPNVSTDTPEDYPRDQRAGFPDGDRP